MKALLRILAALLCFGAAVPSFSQVTTRYGVSYVGPYSSGSTYAKGDMATYSGSTFVSILGSNIGNTPSSSPTYWLAIGGGGTATGWINAGSSLSSAVTTCGSNQTIIQITQAIAVSSGITVPANCTLWFQSGGQLTGTSITINGAVLAPAEQPIFGAGLAVLLGPNTPRVYAEWFGAKGDGSTDDSTALQAALNAISGGGSAGTNTGTGELDLLAKIYVANTGLTIQNGGVSIVGVNEGMSASTGFMSTLKTTSASITQISVTGPAGFPTNAIQDNHFQNFTLVRTTQPTGTSTGISVQSTFRTVVDTVFINDSIRGIYIANVGSGGSGRFDNVSVYYTSTSATGSGPYYGFYIDESGSNTTPSLRIRNSNVGANTTGYTTLYGLYATGPHIEDLHVRNLETALTGYGVYLNSTGGSGATNADNLFQDSVLDRCQVSCVYITGMTSSGASSVSIDGGWANAESSSPMIDVESSNGVVVKGMAVGSINSSRTDIKVNGGSANNITANNLLPLQSSSTGILLNSTTDNVVSSNTIRGSSTTSVTGISLTSATRSVLSGNSLSGSMTTGVSLDASSGNNDLYNVAQIDPTSITTPYSNSGTGNQIGVGGGTYTGSSPIVVSGSVVSCPTCSTGGSSTSITNITSSVTATGCTISGNVCTVGTAVNSVTLSSIPGTYTHLQIVENARVSDSADHEAIFLQLNGDTTAADYTAQDLFASASTITAQWLNAVGAGAQACLASGSTAVANAASGCTITIYNYAGSTFAKNYWAASSSIGSTSVATTSFNYDLKGIWTATPAAVTSVKLTDAGGGNLVVGSTFTIYGIP